MQHHQKEIEFERKNSYEINFNQEEEKVIEPEEILKQTELLSSELDNGPTTSRKSFTISKKMKYFLIVLVILALFLAINVSLLFLSKAKSSTTPLDYNQYKSNITNTTDKNDSTSDQTQNNGKPNNSEDSQNKTNEETEEDILYPRQLHFLINQSQYMFPKTILEGKNSHFITILNLSIYFETADEFNIKLSSANTSESQSLFTLPDKYPFPSTKFVYNPSEEMIRTNYTIVFDNNNTHNFSLKIRRKNTKELIFDTTKTEFIYSTRFIEFGTKLPSNFLFGLGERKSEFLYTPGAYTIWNRNDVSEIDNGTPGHQASGTHPVYLAREKSGNFHVMLLKNANGMQFEFNAQNELKFKLIGGIIDLKFFIGDKYPENSIKQYHYFINGFKMFPFWTFGTHQAIIGSVDPEKINEILNKYQENGLPLDILWSDIELMRKCNKTNNISAYEIILNMKKKTRFINEIKLGIPIQPDNEFFQDALNYDNLIKSSKTKKPLIACQCTDKIIYPDFNHVNITKYWSNILLKYYDKTHFDGIALSFNEPTLAKDFEGELTDLDANCPSTQQNDNNEFIKKAFENFTGWIDYSLTPIDQHSLPFLPQQNLEKETLSIDSYHYNNSEFFTLSEIRELDFHNLNGFLSAYYTAKVLKENINFLNPLVFTKSTVFGAGNFAAQWSGETIFSWSFLKTSISSLFKAGLFGLPFSGSDICSFSDDFNSELCARWVQIGAFYPIFRLRISSNVADKGIFSFNESFVLEAAKASLKLRYSILKYYYSIYEKKNAVGVVFKPLFFEFIEEEILYDIESQFMLGDDVMVTPLLEQKLEVVSVYFPINIKWANFITGEIFLNTGGFKQDVTSKLNESCPMFVREGKIVYYQKIENITNTNELNNNFRLFAVMRNISKDEFIAEGQILVVSNYSDEKKIQSCRKNNNNQQENNCFLNISLKATIMGPPDYLISASLEFIAEKDTIIDDDFYIEGVEILGIQVKEKFSKKTMDFDPKLKIEKNLKKTFINT